MRQGLKIALAGAALALGCAVAALAESPAGGPGQTAAATVGEASPKANPLWAIALENLSATRERPLFSPSRRPPAPPPVAAAPVDIEPPPPPPPGPPEKPNVTLVGVVRGDSQDIGIFINQMDQSVVRLRVGQEDRGWVVHSVDIRAATLRKDNQQVRLELPARDATGPEGAQFASIVPGAPGAPPPPGGFPLRHPPR